MGSVSRSLTKETSPAKRKRLLRRDQVSASASFFSSEGNDTMNHQLRSIERRVLTALKRNVYKGDRSIALISQIANEVGASERAVRAALRDLERLGEIVRQRNNGPWPNTYILLDPSR